MNLRPLIGLTLIGVIGLFSLVNIASAQQASSPSQAASADQTYMLGPADVIEVSVLGQADFTTRGRIGEDGTIRLPYLGSVPAGGRTISQLSDEVGKALNKGGFYSHAIVKVEIVSYASRYVTVLGDVTSPGLIPVDRAYRLSEILARVGGVKDTGADYVVLRAPSGPEMSPAISKRSSG